MGTDRHTLPIEGDVSIYTVGELKSQLLQAMTQHPALDLDLTMVTEIDGAGVQLLMSARKQALAMGQTLTLSNHSMPVIEMWERLDLAGWFGDPLILPARD
jgi:anti-anti-sigma factor